MKPLQPFKQMSNPVITLSERIANPTSIREMIGEDLFINEVQIAPWVIDEVKKLEEQNEKMLDAFRSLLLDMDNVDRVCDLAGVHPFTGMRSVIQSFVNEGEKK
jgi:hypothetical protein